MLALVSALAWLCPSNAHSQSPSEEGEGAAVGELPDAASANSSPIPLNTVTSYPSTGSGASEVLLELVVTGLGGVGDVRSLNGSSPFVESALQAATNWRFVPARRGGENVAAKIRFLVKFFPPVESGIAPRADDSSVQGVAVAPAAEGTSEVVEVLVRGQVVEPGARVLGSSEVRVLPGAFGDPFRAVSSLPGVAPLVTGLPVSFVRGSPPGNVGFRLDDIRMPLLFHAFLGPSVVHPRLIESVTLHAGGYPASVGRHAGGVVSAELAEPRERPEAEVSVRLVDTGAFVEAPFAEGRGRALLAGRYSYTALLLSLLSDFELSYWDYQGLLSYDLSSRGTLSVLSLGAFDYAGPQGASSQEDSEDGANAVSFHRFDLRYDHRIGQDTQARVAATWGADQTRGATGRVKDDVLSLRLTLKSRVASNAQLRVGADWQQDRYQLELESDTAKFLDVVSLFPSRVDSVWGVHGDLVWDIASRLRVTPGLRVDRYQSADRVRWAVSPRLALNTRLSESISVEHAIGLAHQTPNYVPGIPGVAVAGLPGGLQRSVQSSAGLKAKWGAGLEGSGTLFYNATFGLTDPFGLNQDLALDADAANVRSLGRTAGVELSVRRRLIGGVGGSLAYTFSRSQRSFERVSTLSGYDRPHVLNLALSKELGAGWLLGVRGLAYSGVPGSRRASDTTQRFDQSRAEVFFRADARLEKKFVVSPRASWTVVAEVLNASLSREVLRRSCEERCLDEKVGPIFLPSLGVIGEL